MPLPKDAIHSVDANHGNLVVILKESIESVGFTDNGNTTQVITKSGTKYQLEDDWHEVAFKAGFLSKEDYDELKAENG